MITPPIIGPSDRPIYVHATFNPRALPLSFGGKTEHTMEMIDIEIIELPIPCRTLENNKKFIDCAIPQNNDDPVKISVPNNIIFLVPSRSDNLPTGRIKIAIAKIVEDVIQFSRDEPIAKSLPIWGRAIFTEEVINGAQKAPKVEMRRIIFLFTLVFMYNHPYVVR